MLLSASIPGHQSVFLAIRQCFRLSTSVSGYPPVFLAIRQCFSLSASVSRYPPVFLAIRQCFSLSASVSGYPPVFLAIRQYHTKKYLFSVTQSPISPSRLNMLLLSGKKLKGECCKREE
ncbi:hypothetical protein QNH48_30050 [Neobacillus sp. YX16]|uniref:hypothetical protein n=1 Tax=Neobacillus sp. YX16 TaxID=3047874 RepID=UPI0024C2B7F7|nr:hypothetical protein [Neobacillus sp. YX16]WHZ03106.1 hypothetical protein QNH48_30050 [Neobacillus sp. YX16]